MPTFDQVWQDGPWRKRGRASAQRAWERMSKADRTLFGIALDNYAKHCHRERSWYSPMYGSTFFGNRKGWRDWLDSELDVAVDSCCDDDDTSGGFGPHDHICRMCPEEEQHPWACDRWQMGCSLAQFAACPAYFGRGG